MYSLIILLPLLSSLIAGLFGRFLGFRGAAIITTSLVFCSALLSSIAFYEVALSACPCYIKAEPWFFCEMFDPSWGFMFDSLTVVMLIVVTGISTLVHLYSISYMAGDPHLPRFMSYLSIFTFFMLMLVTADNFLQMFFGWEGVGLASYLLINFWFTRLAANKAAIQAMLVNRVGDFGLALGIMALFNEFKTSDFATVFATTPQYKLQNEDLSSLSLQSGIGENAETSFANIDTINSGLSEMGSSVSSFEGTSSFIFCNLELDPLTTICILLFIGAVGKSAQLGLHVWLPSAMEGPTPVSALIHAATMVTAGVFMMARCSPLFEYAPTALMIVTFVGGMTAFFAATTGVVQNDLKRVIAYSTCSQLGYMVFVCGLSHYSVGVFHLMNHAFFKALLFLSAGAIIHSLSDEQDMRKMGGLAKLLPFTYGAMLIGSLSLTGFPFLTGFYSKDVILEVSYAKWSLSGNFAGILGSICVLFTSYYSFRLLFLTFFTKSNTFKQSIKKTEELPFLMALPLILLIFGSIFIGYLAKDMTIGLGTPFWGNSLFILPKNGVLLESEYIPQSQKFIPLISTLLGALGAFFINYSGSLKNKDYFIYSLKKTTIGRNLYYFLNKRWLFDKVYNDFIAQKCLSFGYQISFKSLDKGFFEILGPFGISRTFREVTKQIRKFQSGMIFHYAVVMLLGLIFMITIVTLWEFLELFVDNRLYFIYLICFFFYHYYLETEVI